ncbi:MAG TPA: helix-turn-helix domain-containing protein, partial [Planctomycetia bacterium]|nr:helix-turn-helix domain-containing protein [Planctomycetia bacterium]
MAQYAGGKTIDDLCAEGKADEPVTTPLFLRVNAIRWAIRRERERQGLTLAALAQAAGIDEPALSRFERGIPAQPRLST